MLVTKTLKSLKAIGHPPLMELEAPLNQTYLNNRMPKHLRIE